MKFQSSGIMMFVLISVLFLGGSSVYAKTAEEYVKSGDDNGSQGNYAQAVSDYTKAIEIDPQSFNAYQIRGETYYKQGNLPQAIADFTKSIEIIPSAKCFEDRGDVYYKQGNLPQAILDYTKSLELGPAFPWESYQKRGAAYVRQGNFPQAILDYTKAIETCPTCVEAYKARGKAYYETKEYDKAWADVHKVESFGYTVDPEFHSKLKDAEGENQANLL